jgi:hypothetical protein
VTSPTPPEAPDAPTDDKGTATSRKRR